MDWQQLVSLVIVAAAAGLLLWRAVRRRQFSFQRETHCGCAAPSSSACPPRIIFRARRGERPQVVVKVK